MIRQGILTFERLAISGVLFLHYSVCQRRDFGCDQSAKLMGPRHVRSNTRIPSGSSNVPGVVILLSVANYHNRIQLFLRHVRTRSFLLARQQEAWVYLGVSVPYFQPNQLPSRDRGKVVLQNRLRP